MRSDFELLALAVVLARAERERRPVAALTHALPDLLPVEAYGIQRLGIQRRLAAGAARLGYKVGLASPAVQDQLGVHEPISGQLLDEMVVDGGVNAKRFIQPRVEVAPAFVLSDPLEGPGITERDVAAATDHVLASIEIIDSRIRDWDVRLADAIADNGLAAALVLGGQPHALGSLEIAAEPARLVLEIDGQVIQRGSTATISGSPLTSVAWLANALAGYGVALQAGQTVLAGASMRSAPVWPGNLVRGTFPSLGAVEIEFTW